MEKRVETKSENFSDWDQYYQSEKFEVPEYIIRVLFKNYESLLRKHIPTDKPLVIIELGGANSCFFERFVNHFNVTEYHIVDNNRVGLEMSNSKKKEKLRIHQAHLFLMDPKSLPRADLVFSGGLIEHFNRAETKACIQAHFDFAVAGGLVMMSFPTPTVPYWLFRKLLEKTGQFPPLFERPLSLEEVNETVDRAGFSLESKVIWATILTQLLVVARKAI